MAKQQDQAPKVVELSLHAKIERPARPDGYRPITDPLWVWGAIGGAPKLEEWRLFSSAARRLDTGHRQIERVRRALDEEPHPGGGSPAARQAMMDVIGDAEMAVWAIDKAIEIASCLSGRYRLAVKFPANVREKQPLVATLRDHYSHIEERALGRVGRNRTRDPEAAAAAFAFDALVTERVLTDGADRLGIDGETTELCVATRDYLVKSWTTLLER